MTLVDAYYWSQIILTVVAAAAGVAAYRQVQTFKQFELMKMLESLPIKDARRMLYFGTKRKKPGEEWWNFESPQFDDELLRSAEIVCGAFDIVGIVAKGANRR